MRVLNLALLGLLAGAQMAAAQTPNSNDIINNLKPQQQDMAGANRGIRRLAPSQHAAPAASPAAAEAGGQRSVNLSVAFASGAARLTPSAEKTLSELGKALTSPDLSGFKFRIEGHTDTVGSAETNQALSQARADAVVAFLKDRFGVSADRLQAVGVGKSDLVVQTPDNTPEPRNRVVKVVNLGG